MQAEGWQLLAMELIAVAGIDNPVSTIFEGLSSSGRPQLHVSCCRGSSPE